MQRAEKKLYCWNEIDLEAKKNDLRRSFSWLISRYAFWILALLPYVNENEMHLPLSLSSLFLLQLFFQDDGDEQTLQMGSLIKIISSSCRNSIFMKSRHHIYILHNKGLKFGKVPACAGMIKPHHVISDR